MVVIGKRRLLVEASNSFNKRYNSLPIKLRKQIDRTIEKLVNDFQHPGLNVEKIQGTRKNIWSCRVTRKIRLIYEITNSGKIRLLYVGTHDDAYREVFVAAMFLPYLITQEYEGLGGFTMFEISHIEITDEIQKDLSKILSDNIVPAIISLIKETIAEGTQGKAKPRREDFPTQQQRAGEVGRSLINVIPSDKVGPCGDVLVAFCFDGDSFGKRLREVAYHAGIHCPETKVVILVTSQWNPREWKRNHRKAFEDLKAVVVIYFVGFGRITRIA